MKKASLTLSIQMVVVVVIAFVVLGLGLGFVRSQFADIGATTKAVQEQIKQQILDDLRTGNKRLSFPTTQVSLAVNQEEVQAVGVRNTKDKQIKFNIKFSVKPTGAMDFTDFSSGVGISGMPFEARVDWDNTPQTLGPGESRVYPVTIRAPNLAENYLYRVQIELLEVGGNTVPSVEKDYDSRTFFVKTS